MYEGMEVLVQVTAVEENSSVFSLIWMR